MKIKYFISIIIFSIIFILPVTVFAESEDSVRVPEEMDFTAALNSSSNIIVTADINISGIGVIDVSNRTINLNGHTVTTNHMGVYFQGTNFKIENGTFVGETDYPLCIGDMGDTDNVILSNLIIDGGINIFNSTNVNLVDVTATGKTYYAVWCDQNGHAIIKSGNYSSNGYAVVALSSTDAEINIEGGIFTAGNIPFTLQPSATIGIPKISGGNFDIPLLPEWIVDNGELIQKDDGSYTVCTHLETLIKNKQEATCQNEGYSGDSYCKNCDKLMQKGNVIPKLDHIFSNWKHDESSHWQECVRCNEIIKSEHNYLDNEKCTICGYEKVITKEELPEQEKIDNKDLVLQEKQKDDTPKTGTYDIIDIALCMVVFSLLGIIIIKKINNL